MLAIDPRLFTILATPYFTQKIRGVKFCNLYNLAFIQTVDLKFHLVSEDSGQPTNAAAQELFKTIARAHPCLAQLDYNEVCRGDVNFEAGLLTLKYRLSKLEIQVTLDPGIPRITRMVVSNSRELVLQMNILEESEVFYRANLLANHFFEVLSSNGAKCFNPYTLKPISAAEIVAHRPTKPEDDIVVVEKPS
jgi:hypothetical protein